MKLKKSGHLNMFFLNGKAKFFSIAIICPINPKKSIVTPNVVFVSLLIILSIWSRMNIYQKNHENLDTLICLY